MQEKGQTLDLILLYGLPVLNVQVGDAVFSDHMPVLFHCNVPRQTLKLCTTARKCLFLKPSTAAQFSSVFNNSALTDTSSACFSTEQLTSSLLSRDILDSFALLRDIRLRPMSEAWATETTRVARGECRRVERRWKKNMPHVSHEILKDSWRKYEKIVGAEKHTHTHTHNSSIQEVQLKIYRDSKAYVQMLLCLHPSTQLQTQTQAELQKQKTN